MPLLQLLLEGVKMLQVAHLQAAGQRLQFSGLAGQTWQQFGTASKLALQRSLHIPILASQR